MKFTKPELRKQIASLTLDAGDELRVHESEQIWGIVEASAEFGRAEVVGLFWSMADEVSTAEFIARWAATKRIVLPCVEGEGLVFREYCGEESMVCGAFSINEPCGAEYEGRIDLMIVPGVAFDAAGHRLGRGKGYYDRYFEAHADRVGTKMGVCFSYQMVEQVPADPHDVAMDRVVSI